MDHVRDNGAIDNNDELGRNWNENGKEQSKSKDDLLNLLGVENEDLLSSSLNIPNSEVKSTRLLSSELWNIIVKLSDYVLEPEWTEIIAETFPYFLTLILNQAWKKITKSSNKVPISKIILTLSKLIGRYSSTLRFCNMVFATVTSPMSTYVDHIYGIGKLNKRARKSSDETGQFLMSLFILMKFLPNSMFSEWDIKPFLNFTNANNEKLRWLSVSCLGLILNLSETDLAIIKKLCNLSDSIDSSFSIELQHEIEFRNSKLSLLPEQQVKFETSLNEIVNLFPASQESTVLSIGNVMVESLMFSSSSAKFKSSLQFCPLKTSVDILREIALSTLSRSTPICLCGPVGSGKTLLLQYAAVLLGRNTYPQIMSVQMSDQIDSKLLLGSYHSTDLPGQFVWKPGCLTKAVLNGNWIIFEDIDAASTDVLTLISGLLDNEKLSVPGYGEIDHIHQEFRVFATYRTQVGKISDKIKGVWNRLTMNHISIEELKYLIDTLFPNFPLVSDRLIEMYNALIEVNAGSFSNERQISLRDFLKFCHRIPLSLDFSQPQSAILLFQEAFDLFASSLRCQTKRIETAEVIGTHLNLLKAKAEYFCSSYKPNLSICCNSNTITAGRYTIKMIQAISGLNRNETSVFSLTKRASCLLEMICGCIKFKEPVLLTGETGVGKTSCVQYLAQILHQKLVVVNLNRQSDSSDLLGGYKPVELKYIFGPIREEFETLFEQTFNHEANSKFLSHIMTCFANRRWKDLLTLMLHIEKTAKTRVIARGTIYPAHLLQRWTDFGNQLSRINLQMQQGEESPFAFSFIEGSLIKAVKNGHWILLDEINLATPEMLQCLYGIIDEHSNINILEKGDETPIVKHENFRLFAAMNPATDVGKKDLPLGLRNRFTEFYVPELTDRTELQVLVTDYLRELSLTSKQTESIVEFYLNIKQMSETTLVDGTGKKPHYSLRTLCRALKIASLTLYGSVSRSLYESFCLSFLTQLDRSSYSVVESLIARYMFGKTEIKSIVNQSLPTPKIGKWVQVEGFWIPQGDGEPIQLEKYILTQTIRNNLKDLARIVSAGKLPVLIQGVTSVGKTSLINYLAKSTGNNCYRINNHQHTDLQEYVGSYQSDENGKLVFTEGVLVQAMRRGEWIILDELNLAPSEVLEALNRVLDDNRQLYIPETGQTVNAHPRFMLFATQNPPGFYGGRKLLSRAFRNRFVELHFDEIPTAELETILHLRCDIPLSYCKKIISVLRELQVRRKASAALEGKHGFATLRDLFRWAERYRLSGKQNERFYDWDQHLADEGYLVLAGKVRQPGEANVIREVLQIHLKRTIVLHNLFSLHENTSTVTKPILEKVLGSNLPEFKHIVWTFQLRKLAVLIGKALQFQEPTLLVGETGCGKTTLVQLLTQLDGHKLYSINCHMNSESSDFIGGLRPVRNHDASNAGRLFEWVNGPLIEAMMDGGIFLSDEISLADDSVLERVNSVLEPERTILISEKGDETPRLIKADPNFHFVGTMNPGGDYGKKELSPALRNRLTEIWCEITSEEEDLIAIVEHNLDDNSKGQEVGRKMVSFVSWLKSNDVGFRWTISIRDYLSWVNFINHACSKLLNMPLPVAIYHGACLVFMDGFGSSSNASGNSSLLKQKKFEAETKLLELINMHDRSFCGGGSSFKFISSSDRIQIGDFFISKNNKSNNSSLLQHSFTLEAPTTSINGLRLFRALQLNKPILLEGSPGVGKTALVSVIAKLCGYPLVRINLSEQTDISDLFGADLPAEGKDGGHFEWRDGPLLQALKSSSWILLDELNLASQSVLEGLNACLDHRGEIYVPELNRTFKVSGESKGTKIICCQNPAYQGGARKGLPKSFLNRFTQVYVDPLSLDDLRFILYTIFPDISKCSIDVMTHFADSVTRAINQLNLFGAKGAPWDFNLRDLIRWCDLLLQHKLQYIYPNPSLFIDLIYGRRMRTLKDSKRMLQLYDEAEFLYRGSARKPVLKCGASGFLLTGNSFICGNGCLPIENAETKGYCRSNKHLLALQRQFPALEALTVSLEKNWMPILVGPSGSGKTSLVKLLAQLTGESLHIMTVSPEMDTMELLGGFEQADVYRKIDELSVGFSEILLSLVQSIVCHNVHELDMMDSQILDLWSSLKSLKRLTPCRYSKYAESMGNNEEAKIRERVDFLETLYKKCKSLLSEKKKSKQKIVENENAAVLTEIEHVEETLEKISLELNMIYSHLKNGIHSGGFQWVDSLLVKSITNGDWLLIDGANRCSASVLDRLNPLVEPSGTLFLSERGCIDGAIKEIKPHPKFRLILAMDPAYGEISRAMRNRGVEIFMPGPDDIYFDENGEETDEILANMNDDCPVVGRILDSGKNVGILSSGKTFEANKLLDLDTLLQAKGLDDAYLRQNLINLHSELQETITASLGTAERPSVLQLVKSVESLFRRVEHGMTFSDALFSSIVSSYITINSRINESLRLKSQTMDCILKFVDHIQPQRTISRLPLSKPNFVTSQMYRVWKQTNILLTALESPEKQIINELVISSSKPPAMLDLLVQSVFLNILNSDATALAKTIAFKLPEFADLSHKIASVINATKSSSNCHLPWDPQWYPHMLVYHKDDETLQDKLFSIVKTSLLMNMLIFTKKEDSEWNAESLGTIAKQIAEGKFLKFKNTDFFSNFFALVKHFDQVMNSTLNSSHETSLRVEDYPTLWQRGISTLLWYRRLLNLTSETWNPLSHRNERLLSNVILITQWIRDDVVPFLQDMSNNMTTGNHMSSLISKCLSSLNQSEDGQASLISSSAEVILFKGICANKPFSVAEGQRARLIEEISETCFTLWSLPIKSDNLVSFFSSYEGRESHLSLCVLCTKIYTGEDFTKDDITTLLNIKLKIKKFCDSSPTTEPQLQQQIEAMDIKKSLFGLKEYLRICYDHKNSSFVSPLLITHNFLNSPSFIKYYLEWEDVERFSSTFISCNMSSENICNSIRTATKSNLLSYLITDIILEKKDGHKSLRTCSLGSREVMRNCLEDLNSILTQRMLDEEKNSDKMAFFAIKKTFIEMLYKIRNVMGDDWEHDNVVQWLSLLEANDVDSSKQKVLLGSVMIQLGVVLMHVSSSLPVVDPVVEKEILAGYIKDEIAFIQNWISVQRIRNFLDNGVDILSYPKEHVHPYVLESLLRLSKLEKLLIETEAGIAHRPNPPNYAAIRNEILQFTKLYGVPEKLNQLICSVVDFQNNSSNINQNDLNSIQTQSQTWIDAHRMFSGKLSKFYWYWDISCGYLFASSLVSKGLCFFSDVLSYLKEVSSSSRLNELLLSLCEFPIPFRNFTSDPSTLTPKPFSYQGSMKSELLVFLNEIETERYLSPFIVERLQKFCEQIACIWEKQEKEKEKKKELEDAMYIYKGKERNMELSEDEQVVMDLSQTFPSFDSNFSDFLEHSLDSQRELSDAEIIPSSSGEELNSETICVFLHAYEKTVRMVKNHWTASQSNFEDGQNFVAPFVQRFELACIQVFNNPSRVSKMVEARFIIGGNLLANHISCNSKQLGFHKLSKIYDFYHDANIDEVQKLTPIFSSLRKRVNVLLLEWSEHPSLLKILKVIDRIETFRADAPLMKFLTGLELLLGTSQEWETCAHQGVSLAIHLSELTEMIITWRKLELHCWKDLLEITFAREQNEAHKWWFHLFSVVNETQTIESSIEFLKVFQQFIETSPIGQFETRLNFLYNLHCHLILLEQNPHWELLTAFTWNVYQFYIQFKDNVSNKLTSLRSPIEKKLKDFVKISRWNDANFYSLKDSVHKSQKTLIKFVKEWKVILQTPVGRFLVADMVESSNKSNKNQFKFPRTSLYLTPSNWSSKMSVDNTTVEKFKIKRLVKLSKLYNKIQKFTKEELEHAENYSEDILALNDLSGTVITTVRELENLQAPGEDGHEKRKKVLRNIHFRRRTALGDLFKVLQQQFNLSYRRGLVNLKNEENLPYDFKIAPVDLDAGWKHLKYETPLANQELIFAWNGCEGYFQKSITRVSQMQKHFQGPSKELSPAIIDRCKGFVGDLITLTTDQKVEISKFSKFLWTLRHLTQQNLGKGVQQVIFKEIYTGICRIEHSTKQLVILLESVTGQDFLEIKTRCREELSVILQKCDHIKDLIKSFVDDIVLIPNPVIEDSDEILAECLEYIEEIRMIFTSLENNSILGESFSEARKQVEAISISIIHNSDADLASTRDLNPSQIRAFEKLMNMLLEKILLTFQKLNHLRASNCKENEEKADEENSSDVQEKFRLVISYFEIEKVSAIVANIFLSFETNNSLVVRSLFNAIIPLLKQYSMLGQFYLTLLVQFHRATCKLLSTLSGLFSSLASKGFCLPADYENEAAEEGEEMDSKAGIGLGDGETNSDAKDVSDRIESEDQLEDTLKQGESIDPADKDLKDDENGIEMPDDFDGKQQERDQSKTGDDENCDSDEEKSDGEEEIDKQMGDVDGDEQMLDEQMWGGSSDEDDDDLNDGDKGRGNNAEQTEPELAAKDPSKTEQNQPPEDKSKVESNHQKPKEINENDSEEEVDDNQTDSYHRKNEEEPEPEPMELPDDLNLDGADPKETEEVEQENPFDLDVNESEEVQNIPEEEKEEIPKDENQIDDDGDNLPEQGIDIELSEVEENKNDNKDEATNSEVTQDEVEDNDDDVTEQQDHDLRKSEEDKIGEKDREKPESVQDTISKSVDPAAEPNSISKENPKESIQNACEDIEDTLNKSDETASGQVESQDGSGHKGKNLKENSQPRENSRQVQEKHRKSGTSDDNRSLINDTDEKQQTANRLKTLHNPEVDPDNEAETVNPEDDDESKSEHNANLYQHIREAEKSDAITIDDATQEQAEKSQKTSENDKMVDEEKHEFEDDVEMQSDSDDVEIIESETLEQVKGRSSDKRSKNQENEETNETETKMEIETDGDIIQTLGVERPLSSTIQTRLDILEEWSKQKAIETIAVGNKNLELANNILSGEEESVALVQWHELENKTLHLAQELCEQLRLILEPTLASRLKGDYKTGKRLNMRKVIPYIASGFRKDKIWLRRTQPSKREYQILLALDNSASMSDNRSKQMAFSAVAVVSKSLGLLEAGQLGVLSFGEDVQLVHGFHDPFSDFTGARLMHRFTFTQRRTRIAQLLDASSNIFLKSRQNLSSNSNEVAQLLLIISDGRGVCNEGTEKVKKAVRKVRDQNIFVVFIIVDNPENKDSILDIRLPIFDKNKIVEIAKYMDHFPFPFYLILRDLSALPTVLSDALRQWFELVTSCER